MEKKIFPLEIKDIDYEGRTLEGYASVFNVTDLGSDRVWPGAFRKTLTERGDKIKFLWQHDTKEPIGRFTKLEEDNHGLFFQAIISQTRRGKDAIELLRDGAIDSLSIGYEAIKGATDYTELDDGKRVRNLRELRLYEASLVSIPMCEEAQVTALKDNEVDEKADIEPEEGKPWNVFKVENQFCVYRVNEDGERMGESRGCHDTREEAEEQMRALYVHVEEDSADLDLDEKATWTAAYINDLPDSSFLYIESGGEKDEDGKTTPRSLRHLPYKDSEGSVDLPHLRNALSRLGQEGTGGDWLSDSLRAKLRAKAERILKRETGDDGKNADLDSEDKEMSLDQRLDAVWRAWREEHPNAYDMSIESYIRETYEDYVIVCIGQEHYKIPYHKEEAEIVFADRDRWQKVEERREWIAVSEEANINLIMEEKETLRKEMTEHGPQQRLGDILNGSIHRVFTLLCDNWYIDGYLTREQRIQLSSLIGDALDVLDSGVPEEIANIPAHGPYGMMGILFDGETKIAPELDEVEAASEETKEEAGPDEPPTSKIEVDALLQAIEFELAEIEYLEVS